MQVTKETMAEIVTEASAKMGEPEFSAGIVGGFVESQTDLAQYISANESDIGGAEGVVNVIFFAGLATRAVEKTLGVPAPLIDFVSLDTASGNTPAKVLQKQQPALYEFIDTNVVEKPKKELLFLILHALTIDISEL